MIEVFLAISLQAKQLCAVDVQTNHKLQCYPIAIGTDATPTPKGQFNVTRMVTNPQYVSCQTGINYGEGFLGDVAIVTDLETVIPNCNFAIHGTSENLENLIGTKATGGCNRLRNRDARHLVQNYEFVGGYID